MAKRLTDCGKWDKRWFRKLSPIHKCFWQYICDRCDFCGIWEVDFETAEHFIGEKLDQAEITKIFAKQYIELGEGRWLLKDFLFFQYGVCNESNTMYKPIVNNLNRYGVSMGDIWRIDGGKVKDKDKVIVKVIDKVIVKDKEAERHEALSRYFNGGK